MLVPVAQGVEDEPLGGGVLTEYTLGPTVLDGAAVKSAKAVSGTDGQWLVVTVLRSGDTGLDPFNVIAGDCFATTDSCPTGDLAIVVDGRVLSTPHITTDHYESAQLQIVGFESEAAARSLAERLSAG